MYKYKGYDRDNEESLSKEFEDEYEAISFADDHAHEYPKYTVVDMEDDEEIHSDKMAQQIIDDTLDDMGLSDEETNQGFDYDDFFGND